MPTSPTAINPNTGKSNAEVMASSNEVATRAAAMIGKGWQPGTFDDSGKGIGGKVISSDTVLQDRDMTDATNEAGNALTTSPSDGRFSLSPLQQQYSNLMFNQQGENLQMFQDAMGAVDLMYDAQLARSNAQYKNLMKDLQSSFQSQSQMAAQQAAALNPYSQAQGAMTARNFQSAIQSKYNEQAARLQEAAAIAQQELAAGNAQAYVEIANAMKQSNQQFQKGMMEFMMNAQSQFQQAQQQERQFSLDVARFGLQQDQFGLQQQQFGESRFMDFVNEFGQDPQVRASIDNFKQTGQITEDLMPIIERGRAIGLTPEQALMTAGQETLAQRQQRVSEEQFAQEMGLRWAEFNQRQNARIQTMQDENADIEDKKKAAIGELVELRSKINELMNDPALDLAVGPNWFARLGGGLSGADRRVELLANEIGATLTVGNLGAMEGVLTDRDVDILRQAAGAEKYTAFDQNFEDYKVNLSTALENIDRVLTNNGISTEQAIQFDMVTPETVGYANQLWEDDNQTSSVSSYYNE